MRLLIFVFNFFVLTVNAQQSNTWFVQFTDKNNSSFSVNNPEDFLSPRAISRREKQNIPITINDLPVSQSYIDSVKNTGAIILNRSKWFNAVSISCDSLILQKVLSFPFVINAVQSTKNKSPGKVNLLSTLQKTVSGPGLNYGAAYNQINMLKGDSLHVNGFKGEGMLIAILDAGFSQTNFLQVFDSLRYNQRIIATKDFVNGGTNVYHSSGHGTAVLSTIAANQPGVMIGTAPHASFALLISEYVSSELLVEEDNWVAAAEYADSIGADIINSSLGYTEFDDPSMDHTYSDMDGNTTRVTIGADIAASKGILVVNSAGNSGSSSWKYIGAPADGDSVLTVGAVNENRKYAPFSSIGPSADGRIKPDVCAQGQNVIVASQAGGTAQSNGTSFSSPIIAGISACLWQAFPELTNMELLTAIRQSADKYNTPGDSLGYGIPDFNYGYKTLLNYSQRLSLNKSFIVYPNPFKDDLKIFFNNSTEDQIIIDIIKYTGEIVAHFVLSPVLYDYTVKDLSELAAGVYMLRIIKGDEIIHSKIIKINN